MAKIVEIGVMFGISQPTGPGAWLKTEASMKIAFDDPSDMENKEAIWEDAWGRVTEECSKQLKRFDSDSK